MIEIFKVYYIVFCIKLNLYTSLYLFNYVTAQSPIDHWICNMCCSGIKYTENEIRSHIFLVHKVTKMFKCPMCQYERSDDNAQKFEEHYKLNHPSVAVKCLKVCEKVSIISFKSNKILYNNKYIIFHSGKEFIDSTFFLKTLISINFVLQ